jgi:16S rRNA (cytosine1402-N4)-methyltransferase
MGFDHTPVLFNEVIEGLSINPKGVYLDGTVGGGGHAAGIAAQLGNKGLLIGIDRDEEAIAAASERLAGFKERVRLIQGNYGESQRILAEQGIEEIDGMLLDLGVSSHQIDQIERGFSYKNDTILDMRMDRRQSKSAWNIVNEYAEEDIYRIIRDYGEERFAKNIARQIVRSREEQPIESTARLNEIIAKAIPARTKRQAEGGHPSKRTYQAIRIECNNELCTLEESLDELVGLLCKGGRFAIITFHSLEDRIVKTAFKRNENPCTCPANFPHCTCGKESQGQVITKKPILPSAAEQERNPRAKSAKLRIFEKTKMR